MPAEHPSTNVDPYNLERFVEAQAPLIEQIISELRAGRKMSHWMWFIFPQIRGLGRSETAIEYAISGLDEARAYLTHPDLGPRLKECTELVLRVENRPLAQILGSPDDMKFRSCMTLFAQVSADDDIFERALQKYFQGKADQLTLDRL